MFVFVCLCVCHNRITAKVINRCHLNLVGLWFGIISGNNRLTFGDDPIPDTDSGSLFHFPRRCRAFQEIIIVTGCISRLTRGNDWCRQEMNLLHFGVIGRTYGVPSPQRVGLRRGLCPSPEVFSTVLLCRNGAVFLVYSEGYCCIKAKIQFVPNHREICHNIFARNARKHPS